MLFFPVYTEAHPRRNAAFASRPDVWALGGNRRRFPVPEMNLRDAVPPATGYSVRKLVTPTTPTDPTGTLYLFSFQSLAEPYSASYSNVTPCIPFISLSLRTISFATGGVHPPPHKKSPVRSFQRFTHISRPSLPRASREDSTWWEPLFSLHGSRVTEHDSRTLSAGNDEFQ
jgi:hypothetical protein